MKNIEWVESQAIKVEDTPQPDGTWLYKLWLPRYLSNWDVFAVWEKERFASMQANLKKGDVLFDIGTEVGWQNIIYAQMVGPENMVLIEPSKAFWPNIKAIWEKNFGNTLPRAAICALFGSEDNGIPDLTGLWPEESRGNITEVMSYSYIHDNGASVPQITIDSYVDKTGIIPTALTMDTEGAEMLILVGAVKTIAKHKPLVWASLHPDLSEKNYKATNEDIFKLMESLGYSSHLLGIDHEEHWLFSPHERKVIV